MSNLSLIVILKVEGVLDIVFVFCLVDPSLGVLDIFRAVDYERGD